MNLYRNFIFLLLSYLPDSEGKKLSIFYLFQEGDTANFLLDELEKFNQEEDKILYNFINSPKVIETIEACRANATPQALSDFVLQLEKEYLDQSEARLITHLERYKKHELLLSDKDLDAYYAIQEEEENKRIDNLVAVIEATIGMAYNKSSNDEEETRWD